MTETPLPSPPKTLVVHSGTYKTGSTAIQLYLARAQAAGALEHARYPVTGRALGLQHINLNAELREGPVFNPRMGSWDDVIREVLEGESTVTVVSTENFSTLTQEQIAVIGDKCRAAGIALRWVHYLREQSTFYNAFYVERLINMRPEFADRINLPFEDFGDWSPINMDLLNYGDYVDRVRAAIPDVDLVLRPFSRAHLAGGDVVSDFCAVTGVPYVAAHVANANVGTGWRTVETARRLTPVIDKARLGYKVRHTEGPQAARIRWVALIRSEMSKVSTEVGWNKESAIYMTPEFREVLRERYRSQNEQVDSYADFDWMEILAEEPVKDYNIGVYDDIPADEVMTVVARVMSVVVTKPQEILDWPTRSDPAPEPVSLLRRAARRARRG